MKKKVKPISLLITLLVAVLFFFLVFPVFHSKAGTLGDTYLYLSRIKAGLNGATDNEVEMILAITPSQSFSETANIKIEIFFPLVDNTEWCRTAGALTVTGVSEGTPDITGHAITAALPPAPSQSLTATCSQGGVSTTVDTITITQVGNITSAQTYGVKISSSTGVIGTSTTTGSRTITVQVSDDNNIDSKAISVFLLTEDTVEVVAEVAAAPTVTCTLNTSQVDLGILYPGGGLQEISVDNQISTSSTNSGYYWAAYGKGNETYAGLYKNDATPYLIQSGTGTGTVDISGGGSEGFGIKLTQPTSATVTPDFATGTPGVYGSLGATEAGARLILYKNSETASAQSSTVYYGARASSSAVSGSYKEHITYVCGGYY